MEGTQLVFDFIKEDIKPKKKFLKILIEIKNEAKAEWFLNKDSDTINELGIKIINKSSVLNYDE